jgi:integrase
MLTKEHALVPLFQKFIQYSYKGKRLKPDGSRIKPQTIVNYEYVLRYLKEYEAQYDTILRIRVISGSNKRLFISERNYWRKFYLQFTNYLYTSKNCYDNYVGTVIKIIRIFFNFLNKDLSIPTGTYYKNFYVCRQEVPIVTLLPEQLQFLINNAPFQEQLGVSLQKAKDIFVFGCTVGLRVSDLFAIKFSDIERVGDSFYLPVKTIKTATSVRIKLPAYAVDIINKFERSSRGRKAIFPPIPLLAQICSPGKCVLAYLCLILF